MPHVPKEEEVLIGSYHLPFRKRIRTYGYAANGKASIREAFGHLETVAVVQMLGAPLSLDMLDSEQEMEDVEDVDENEPAPKARSARVWEVSRSSELGRRRTAHTKRAPSTRLGSARSSAERFAPSSAKREASACKPAARVDTRRGQHRSTHEERNTCAGLPARVAHCRAQPPPTSQTEGRAAVWPQPRQLSTERAAAKHARAQRPGALHMAHAQPYCKEHGA